MLHINDINSNTKRAKVQPFLDILSPAFQSSYTPQKAIAVDESMITFKGRVSFLQYLKGKPWGKAFVLSDSLTGYMQSVCIYYGKETLFINTDHPHTTRVVLTVVQLLHNRGHDLYVDRFYSSPLLATELSKVGIMITDTVQCNWKGLSKESQQRTRNRLELLRQLAQETYLPFMAGQKEGPDDYYQA